MSRRYTSSPPCASIGVLWDCLSLLWAYRGWEDFCFSKTKQLRVGMTGRLPFMASQPSLNPYGDSVMNSTKFHCGSCSKDTDFEHGMKSEMQQANPGIVPADSQ
jgi:hypothetical protein